MPDFSLHDAVESAPWTCATCGAHLGPFVALNIEYPGQPNVELCATCVTQAARMIGFTDAGIEAELRTLLAEQSQLINVYQADLAEARSGQPKVVPLEEVKEELASKPKSAPKRRAKKGASKLKSTPKSTPWLFGATTKSATRSTATKKS